MKARPREFVMYKITALLGEAECYISCFPQQRWDFKERDKKHVKLSRKHLTMVIPKEDFEKHWKMVDERQ